LRRENKALREKRKHKKKLKEERRREGKIRITFQITF